MERILYIIRGVPGSGKTTMAHQLVGEANTHEADQYMMVGGEYVFDPKNLPNAHKRCIEAVEMDMVNNVQKIAVSNTFVKKEHFFPYKNLAEKFGYKVSILKMENEFPNVHNVPAHTVERMRNQFEQ